MSGWLRTAAIRGFHRFGGVEMVRYRNRLAPKVLMYHRFSLGGRTLEQQLEQHCAHLRKHYRPVSEENLRAWLTEEQPLPENAVLVTVDDGYEDFYTVGLPIFSRFDIPALVFIATDFVDTRAWMWWDKVEYLFANTQRTRVEIEKGEGKLVFGLDSPEERDAAQDRVVQLSKRMPEGRKLELLKELERALEVRAPAHPTPEYAPMNWEQVRKAAAQGTSFGGHTCTHPILTRLPSSEAVFWEVSQSKRRLEENVPRRVTSFAYPNGHEADLDEEAVGAVRKSGYELAFVADSGLVQRGDDPFRLLRIGMDFSMPYDYFERQVAGFRMRRRAR